MTMARFPQKIILDIKIKYFLPILFFYQCILHEFLRHFFLPYSKEKGSDFYLLYLYLSDFKARFILLFYSGFFINILFKDVKKRSACEV